MFSYPLKGKEYVNSCFHRRYLEGFLRIMPSVLKEHWCHMKLSGVFYCLACVIFNLDRLGVFYMLDSQPPCRLLVY